MRLQFRTELWSVLSSGTGTGSDSGLGFRFWFWPRPWLSFWVRLQLWTEFRLALSSVSAIDFVCLALRTGPGFGAGSGVWFCFWLRCRWKCNIVI